MPQIDLTGTLTALDIPDPVYLLSLYNEEIREGKKTLHKWQIEALLQFAERPPVGRVRRQVIVANNGSGKSQFLIAPCAAWLAMAFVRSRSVITSSSGTQLDRQTGAALDHICQQVNKLHGQDLWQINYRFYTFKPTGATIELYATDNPALAEGYHPHLGGEEFAMFVDEGKTVSEDIYRAIERCNGMTRRMDVSSPGAPSGHLYTVFNGGFWLSRKVTYHDCPHIKQDEVDEALRSCGSQGVNHPWFRSAYLAEFTSQDEQVVIGYDLLNRQLDRVRRKEISSLTFGEKFAGLDISMSTGGDESVLSVWHGNVQLALECARLSDPMNWIIDMFAKHSLVASNVYVDDGGIGKGITNELWRRGFEVNRLLFGASPIGDKSRFGNRATEMWFNFAEILPDIVLIDDEVQTRQLANRYYNQGGVNEKLTLESKKEAKSKGHPSPDRGDATVIAFANKRYPYVANKECYVGSGEKPRERLTLEQLIAEHEKQKFGFADDRREIQPVRNISLGGYYGDIKDRNLLLQ